MIGPPRLLYNQSQQSSSEDEAPLQNGRNNNPDQQTQAAATDKVQYYDEKSESSQNETEIPTDLFSLGIPAQTMVTLQGHRKSVTAIDVDPKGYRMVTGSLDYTMRMWDFHGMNKSMNSFRVTEPIEGNAIRNLSYNTSGTHILVVCGGKQVMMADKDGAKGLLTVKGYMYIKNLSKTKGHIATVYDGSFHPFNHNQFVTCSGDGSIRLWDMEQKLEGIEEELGHKVLLRCLNDKSHNVGVTACNWTNDANMVIGGCLDGSIQVFSTKHNFHRPEMLVRGAHKPDQQFTKILPFPEGPKFASRHLDGSLKVWDLRKFTHPIVQQFGLPNYFPGSKMCFSPNGQYLVVGTSVSKIKEERESALLFMDPITLDVKRKMTMGEYSVTDVKWSKALNQIMVGTTNAEAHIYFDQRLSRKGALDCISKKPRVQKDFSFGYSAPVYNPHSLPIFKERPTNNIKKDIRKIRKDHNLSMNPEFPQQGPNKGGRQVVANTVTQHMIQTINANPEKVDDARVPILQIANYTNRHKEFTEAYQITQPKAIYNEEPQQQKEFELLSKIKQICPHCGMKLCTCARKYMIDPAEDG